MLRPVLDNLPPLVGATLALALVPAVARATSPGTPLLPPGKVGLVGVSAGVRTVPDSPFRATSEKLGHPMATHGALSPNLLVPFMYRIDTEWTVLVEGGAGVDRYALTDGTKLGLTTITLQVGAQRAFDLGLPRLEPFVQAGLGYYLSTFTLQGGAEDGRSAEAHTTGAFVGAGLRVAMTPDVGLVLEDRYAFAIVGLSGLGDTSVGGNTASLGLYYVWREDPR